MAILRTRSRLLASAPPPSPIATGKGLRSAAVDDQILSEYLEKTLQIPDLILPESHFSGKVDSLIPDEIDFSSLVSRENDSIHKLLGSVAEFGFFSLIGHGISADELQSTFAEAECVFQVSEKKKGDLDRVFGPKMGNREEFFWFRSGKPAIKLLQEEIGPGRYRKLSSNIENIFSRLEEVAENVFQILTEFIGKPDEKRDDQVGESVLCLYRYDRNLLEDTLSPFDGQGEENAGPFDHALSLYLFDCDHSFYIQSQKGLLSFKPCRGTIIVTIRKQFEAWSPKGFNHVVQEPIFFEPDMHGSHHYSLEFMCSPSSLNPEHNQMIKKVSLTDQIFIVVAVAIFYSFLKCVLSWFGEM